MSDIYDRIDRGDYETALPYPSKPKLPPPMQKMAGELTDEEATSLPKLKADYAAALAAHREAIDAYHADDNRLKCQFWDDLREHYGVPAGDPFVNRMEGLAWDRGHSAGYSDVLSAFGDLMPLYELYAAKKG